MKRRRNPYANSYHCSRTPDKVRYLKAAFAWEVGARQVKKSGIPLYIYRCETCDGWHLSKENWDGATRITTKAAPTTEDVR